MSDPNIDERLAALSARTAPLRARPGFADRVMLAVEADHAPAFGVALWRSALRLAPLAALAAVAAVVWAVTTSDATSAMLAAADTTEFEW